MDRNSNFNTVTSYNCTTDEWTEHPPLPEKRASCAAAVLNQDQFVVVGGYAGNKDKEKYTYLYDSKTKSWTRLPDLKKRRWSPACVCVDNKVYAIGGYNTDDRKDEDSIEMLDLSVAQPSWTILPTRMKQARYRFAAVVDYNGDIVVTGGFNRDDLRLNSVEVFDTHNQVWKTTHSIPPMLTARSWHSLVALKNGRILVALGGRTNTDYASTSVELFMLDNDGNDVQWIPMPSMEVGRRGFAAFATTTTTPPGILVAGGYGNNYKTLDTMEFVQEPLQDDLVYWSLLNPPPLEKPALATEGPTADTSIVKAQAEEWMDGIEQRREDYETQVDTVLRRIGGESVDNIASSRRLATPPEERIKRLEEALEKFRDSIDNEVGIVRSSYPSLGVRGAVVRTNQGDDSSLSDVSHDSFPSNSSVSDGTSEAPSAQVPFFVGDMRSALPNPDEHNPDDSSSVSSTSNAQEWEDASSGDGDIEASLSDSREDTSSTFSSDAGMSGDTSSSGQASGQTSVFSDCLSGAPPPSCEVNIPFQHMPMQLML